MKKWYLFLLIIIVIVFPLLKSIDSLQKENAELSAGVDYWKQQYELVTPLNLGSAGVEVLMQNEINALKRQNAILDDELKYLEGKK